MRVLVIDDDPALLSNVRDWLAGSGFIVDVATGAGEGLEAARTEHYEAVVLDVMLGEQTDGVEVARSLRGAGVGSPILMLTARDAVPDRVRGLEAGADDYLVKPFALEELEARLRALLRRQLADRSSILHFGDVELDTGKRQATVAGRAVRLTEKETGVLEYLLLSRHAPCPQAAIFASVWGYADAPTLNLVDVYIGRLRRKLATAGAGITIVACKRQGYVLEEAGASASRSETGVA